VTGYFTVSVSGTTPLSVATGGVSTTVASVGWSGVGCTGSSSTDTMTTLSTAITTGSTNQTGNNPLNTGAGSNCGSTCGRYKLQGTTTPVSINGAAAVSRTIGTMWTEGGYQWVLAMSTTCRSLAC